MPGYSSSHSRGRQRILAQLPSNPVAKIWNTPGTPTDDVGINGDFAVDTADWSIWGPKASNTWTGTKTALKNNNVPKTYWNFGAAVNAANMGSILTAPGFKPGDYYLFGPTQEQVTSGFNYTYFWVNTDRAQNPPAFIASTPIGNWVCLIAAASSSSGGSGTAGDGSGGGGDGGGGGL